MHSRFETYNRLVTIQLWIDACTIWIIWYLFLVIEFCHRYIFIVYWSGLRARTEILLFGKLQLSGDILSALLNEFQLQLLGNCLQGRRISLVSLNNYLLYGSWRPILILLNWRSCWWSEIHKWWRLFNIFCWKNVLISIKHFLQHTTTCWSA